MAADFFAQLEAVVNLNRAATNIHFGTEYADVVSRLEGPKADAHWSSGSLLLHGPGNRYWSWSAESKDTEPEDVTSWVSGMFNRFNPRLNVNDRGSFTATIGGFLYKPASDPVLCSVNLDKSQENGNMLPILQLSRRDTKTILAGTSASSTVMVVDGSSVRLIDSWLRHKNRRASLQERGPVRAAKLSPDGAGGDRVTRRRGYDLVGQHGPDRADVPFTRRFRQ